MVKDAFDYYGENVPELAHRKWVKEHYCDWCKDQIADNRPSYNIDGEEVCEECCAKYIKENIDEFLLEYKNEVFDFFNIQIIDKGE